MATKRAVKKVVKKAVKKSAPKPIPEAKECFVIMEKPTDYVGDSYYATKNTLMTDLETYFKDFDSVDEALVYKLVPYKRYRRGGVVEVT